MRYPTIRDVAKLANTSTATVSYVLSGNTERPISTELRERVLDAAQKLHYTKSAVASGLRTKRRGVVSILIPQFSNVYFVRACERIEDIVFQNGFLPMICDTREEPDHERLLVESVVSQRVQGVVLGPTNEGWRNTQILRDLDIPYVVIGRELDSLGQDDKESFYVGDDSYQAGYLAGECFVKNGHKDIAAIEWNSKVTSASGRKEGFYDATKGQVSKGGRLELEVSDKVTSEEGYRLTKKLLERFRPTALLYGYHVYAQGGLRYLHEIGIRIPEDISIIIIGTPSWATMHSLQYHVINQREEWVGDMAGRILMAKILETNSSLLREHRYVCPCSLIEGNSVKNLNTQ